MSIDPNQGRRDDQVVETDRVAQILAWIAGIVAALAAVSCVCGGPL